MSSECALQLSGLTHFKYLITKMNHVAERETEVKVSQSVNYVLKVQCCCFVTTRISVIGTRGDITEIAIDQETDKYKFDFGVRTIIKANSKMFFI